jgi:hypothetical protein
MAEVGGLLAVFNVSQSSVGGSGPAAIAPSSSSHR